MLTEKRIREAQSRIVDLFAEQCLHGEQRRELSMEGLTACGQFIGEKAKLDRQKGIHGSAAALRTLARSNHPSAGTLCIGLIGYLAAELGLAVGTKLQAEFFRDEPTDDAFNVIKLSEVLLALRAVPTAIYPTDYLQKQIADRLMSGRREDRGWGYYIHTGPEDSEVDALPTAYAVLALSSYGQPLPGPVEYLFRRLERHDERIGSDIMTSVLSCYVLAFSPNIGNLTDLSRLEALFKKRWRLLESLLGSDIEQNIEYPRGDKHEYIRVPWQLYMLAAASKLNPYSGFASSAAQRRLASIVDDVLTTGFRYPHSGDKISSRTNAILYDVLEQILGQLGYRPVYAVVNFCDKIRVYLGARVVTGFSAFLALAFIVCTVYAWVFTPRSNLASVAPEFIGSAMITLLMAIRKTR